MFSRAVLLQISPASTQVRGMATLKHISMRLKAVTNIQKITKSMKMVSAAKYTRAERELKAARVYGVGAKAAFDKMEIEKDESKPKHLVIAMTSDRGLCGAVHSSISRILKVTIPEKKEAGADVKIVCIGDKSKAVLGRLFKEDVLMSFFDIGKKVPTFGDAGQVANAILESEFEFDLGELHFNRFRSVVSYVTTEMPVYNKKQLETSKNIGIYDSLDADVLTSYNEFAMANLLYYAMKENACSEQSSRMTAMDNATKNAGEMIDKLRLTYNRTRQSVITRELIEIISGAAALKK